MNCATMVILYSFNFHRNRYMRIFDLSSRFLKVDLTCIISCSGKPNPEQQ